MLKNLAIIGAGKWGKNLVRNFYQLGVLHTICDTNEELLHSYQKNYPDVVRTTNSDFVCNNPLIRCIVISTSSTLHYKLTKQALLAGKDVYVEKPLCLNLHEGEELIFLAKRRAQILMVGHILQYHPCVCRLKELISRGELGTLQYIASHRLDFGPLHTEENALWNFAPHDVSLILSLARNELPLQVRCTGGAYTSCGVEDIVVTNLQFKNNLRAHIYVSRLNPFKEQKLVVVGSSGVAVFDDTQGWNNKLTFRKNCSKNIEKIITSEEEPLLIECKHFVECCRYRKTPKTDGQESLYVLKVLEAAEASLHEDGAIKIPIWHKEKALHASFLQENLAKDQDLPSIYKTDRHFQTWQ